MYNINFYDCTQYQLFQVISILSLYLITKLFQHFKIMPQTGQTSFQYSTAADWKNFLDYIGDLTSAFKRFKTGVSNYSICRRKENTKVDFAEIDQSFLGNFKNVCVSA